MNPNRKRTRSARGIVEKETARDQGIPVVARPDQDLAHDDPVLPGDEGERIGEREIVEVAPRRRERVNHVAHLVAFAEPDRVAEVVGDDGEVVAMIRDVGGKEAPLAPGGDGLLAPVRCLPIHFGLKLIGLDEPRHAGRVGADLREEEHDPVGAAGVARHRGLAGPAALDGAIDEGQRLGGVPGLRGQEDGSEHASS